jgi:hypothetical protein
MSLSNIIAEKTAASVLSSNRSLSLITTTTFAKVGTSLTEVVNDTTAAAKTAVNSKVGAPEQLYAPIYAMQKYAGDRDPVNADKYATAAAQSIQTIEGSASSSLPGSNNSLYDIQNKSREAVGSGVSTFGTMIHNVNPTVSAGATNVGVAGLAETDKLIDSSVTNAYAASTTSLKGSISNINTMLSTQSLAVPPTNLKLKELPTEPPKPTVLNPITKVTTSGINEGDAPSREANSTDVIYQDVKLYVEGVQVPFESCSVSQGMGQLPSAMFQIPPQAGLMDIARYYQPKVHIFYTDTALGGDRLLFWGHIVACNYAHSQENSSATIAFSCIHKNALLDQLTLEWSGGGINASLSNSNLTDTNPDQSVVQINNFNSEYSMQLALQGITGNQKDAKDLIEPDNALVNGADVTLLDKRFQAFEKRLVGMPTIMMNLWNQIKREVYSTEKLNVIFSKVYVPLVEEGVRFFDRVSGHPYLEDQIHKSRVQHCNDNARPEASKHDTMLPPAYHMDIQSAVQTQISLGLLKSSLGFSGEMTSFFNLFTQFYESVEYQIITMASPAEVPIDPTIKVDPDNLQSWRLQEKMAIETIIKPQTPFYYAPICNVLLPNMFHSVTVTQQEDQLPTRITAVDTSAGQATDDPKKIGANYRAPHSIRESIATSRQFMSKSAPSDMAKPVSLRDTTGSSFNIPGKYEIGRGIKHEKIFMPNWLTTFSRNQNNLRNSKSDEQFPLQGSVEHRNLLNLHFAWIARFGYSETYDAESGGMVAIRNRGLDALNPYSTRSGLMAHERLLFSAADYEYTKKMAQSRHGSVECLFNPYIIPGYPMDIIDPSPNHPSFHAMCGSVTHSFTSRGISTSIGFMAAQTYAEISNYEMPPLHPWLRNALKIINVERGTTLTEGGDTAKDTDDIQVSSVKDPITGKSSTDSSYEAQADKVNKNYSSNYGLPPDDRYDSNTGDVESVQQSLIGNPRAKFVADLYYRSVLGVGAADPGQIYNFEAGGYSPVERQGGIWVEGKRDHNTAAHGGERNDNLTGVGNLRLVSRPIEGKLSIETKFQIKFIDMIPQNYNATSITYQNTVTTANRLKEPGQSLFLDYRNTSDVIKDVNNPPIVPAPVVDTGTRGGTRGGQ